MSHYSNIKCEIRDVDCLVESLKKFGFQPTVHDTPVNLIGYENSTRPETAHVVVPKKQISQVSNDLGFFKEPNGTYRIIISDHDKEHGNSKARYGLGKNFVNNLMKEYAVATVEKQVSSMKNVETTGIETLADGRIKITLSASKSSKLDSSLSRSL